MTDEESGIDMPEERDVAIARAIRHAYQTAAAQPIADHPDEDSWVRFACGEVPEDERLRIADHVVECAACRSIYRALRELQANARQFDRGVPGMRAPLNFPVRKAIVSFRTIGILAAGVALAVAGAVMWRVRPQPTPPTASVSQPELRPAPDVSGPPRVDVPPLPLEKPPVKLALATGLIVRSPDVDTQAFLEAFGEAIEPYRADRFDEAVRRLTALTERTPSSAEAWFYLGVSLLFQNRPADAARALERGGASDVFHDDVVWYGAVAAERSGDRTGARSRLQSLCDGQSPYKMQACDALTARPDTR